MNIIATVGPKTIDKWVIKELIENGVDILRLNCAHFNKDEFETVINYSKSINSEIHILVDLSGKKVRISKSLKYIYKVYNNQEVFFCGEDYYNSLNNKELGDKKYIPLNLNTDKIKISKIENISIKDNTMKFHVLDVKEGVIKAKVMKGGIIRAGKGCNISTINDDGRVISKKDKDNILWAINNNLDIICQSFVESKQDIDEIKRFIGEKIGERKYDIWAKIETPKGINNIEDIITAVDTVVVGRGDLVAEAGFLESVRLQEKAIKIVKGKNKRIIIATHILNSMKEGNLATLPEIESIYGFINKGVNGFLLAGETSIGKAPIQTVKFLKTAIEYYKKDIKFE